MQAADIVVIVVYTFMIYCSVLWLTLFFKNRKKFFSNQKPKRLPSITFLIPAYNEEKRLGRCLNSIFSLNYPKEKLKVIVIDDGSTDKTPDVAKSYKKVKLLRQKHAGKAAALNYGLKYVNTELVATMDADSFPDPNYLLKLVGAFRRKEVAATTPAIKVTEVNSWVRKIQWVEYSFQIFLRRIFSIFECEYVVPGPGGIYRTSVLKEVGGWKENCLAEDMEITFRLREAGYRVVNAVDAYTYTDTPKDFKALWKQRIRWFRGYLENVKKYFHMVANPSYGNWGFFFLPANFLWMFALGFLFFSTLYNFFGDFLRFITTWKYMNYIILLPEIKPTLLWLGSFSFFHVFFLVIGLLSIWLSITLSGEKVNLRKNIERYLLFLFIYPILISLWWIVAIAYEMLGIRKKW